jgi:hypothetical protein
MDKDKKNKIRIVVREVMSQKVNSLINDDLVLDGEETYEFSEDEE